MTTTTTSTANALIPCGSWERPTPRRRRHTESRSLLAHTRRTEMFHKSAHKSLHGRQGDQQHFVFVLEIYGTPFLITSTARAHTRAKSVRASHKLPIHISAIIEEDSRCRIALLPKTLSRSSHTLQSLWRITTSHSFFYHRHFTRFFTHLRNEQSEFGEILVRRRRVSLGSLDSPNPMELGSDDIFT